MCTHLEVFVCVCQSRSPIVIIDFVRTRGTPERPRGGLPACPILLVLWFFCVTTFSEPEARRSGPGLAREVGRCRVPTETGQMPTPGACPFPSASRNAPAFQIPRGGRARSSGSPSDPSIRPHPGEGWRALGFLNSRLCRTGGPDLRAGTPHAGARPPEPAHREPGLRPRTPRRGGTGLRFSHQSAPRAMPGTAHRLWSGRELVLPACLRAGVPSHPSLTPKDLVQFSTRFSFF